MTAPLTLESTRKQIEIRLREIDVLRNIESLLAELESLQGQTAPIPGTPTPTLTPRELAVGRALAWEGLSVAEIARRRWVSQNTVKSQVKSLYRKLGTDEAGLSAALGVTGVVL